MAWEVQPLTHLVQAMHPLVQEARTLGPFSWLEQLTTACFFTGSIVMTLFGQVLAHRPQPTQRRGSICAMPFSMQIASAGHTSVQLPYPRQPKVQAEAPPNSSLAAEHVRTPS